MVPFANFDQSAQSLSFRAGEILTRRLTPLAGVLYVDSGKVAQGVLKDDKLEHQLGLVQGPSWLDLAPAILGQSSLLDAVAQSEVRVRRVPIQVFKKSLSDLAPPALGVLRDLAAAHVQQTELSVSRMVKDAESRCAEWLIRNAQEVKAGEWVVPIQQRKRLIAAQLGIAPETFSRVLRQLRERGLIAGTGRNFVLPQWLDLRELAGL